MSKTRIYIVATRTEGTGTAPNRLVRAANRAQAERHVARGIIVAKVASQDELIENLQQGIETAGEDATEEEPGDVEQ